MACEYAQTVIVADRFLNDPLVAHAELFFVISNCFSYVAHAIYEKWWKVRVSNDVIYPRWHPITHTDGSITTDLFMLQYVEREKRKDWARAVIV